GPPTRDYESGGRTFESFRARQLSVWAVCSFINCPFLPFVTFASGKHRGSTRAVKLLLGQRASAHADDSAEVVTCRRTAWDGDCRLLRRRYFDASRFYPRPNPRSVARQSMRIVRHIAVACN